MTSLEPDDERLLERIVTGEIELEAPEARARRAASPALDAALTQWQRVRADLESVRIADEALIETAREAVTRADTELVASLVDAARADHRAQASRSFPWRGALAAAAALLLLGLFLTRTQDDGADRDRGPTAALGSEACVRPKGVVDAYGPFVVDVELAPLWTVEIVVTDDDGRELARSGPLEEPRWELSAEDAARLADVPRIRWRYDLLDPTGDAREVGACDAARAP